MLSSLQSRVLTRPKFKRIYHGASEPMAPGDDSPLADLSPPIQICHLSCILAPFLSLPMHFGYMVGHRRCLVSFVHGRRATVKTTNALVTPRLSPFLPRSLESICLRSSVFYRLWNLIQVGKHFYCPLFVYTA